MFKEVTQDKRIKVSWKDIEDIPDLVSQYIALVVYGYRNINKVSSFAGELLHDIFEDGKIVELLDGKIPDIDAEADEEIKRLDGMIEAIDDLMEQLKKLKGEQDE